MEELAGRLNISVYQLEELINELCLSNLEELNHLISKRIAIMKSWHENTSPPYLPGTRDILMVSVHDVNFSRRTLNILEDRSIRTLYQVKHFGKRNLLMIRNCGEKVVDEIKEQLRIRGHELAP
jgi:DNA-directed RNA polymerase alpha subunit